MSEVATTSRAKRFERRQAPAPFQLTERDLKILGHVARHRFLSSQHLAKLDGRSEQNLLRYLRILFDHKYLDRPYTQLAHVPISGPRPMPVVRSNFERTSFNRELLIYWEAWKKKLPVEQFGVSQIRVLTITDSTKRIVNMLSAVDEITAGKGSNFFVFGDLRTLNAQNALNLALTTGKRTVVRLSD